MDATDFGSIYQRYAPDVLRFTLYLCGNRADAEDILSETFIRAWTSPAGIRVGTVKAYLLMIARNLHLDRMRAGSRTTAKPSKPERSWPARRGSSMWCHSIAHDARR
jgi:DNA-directed RNA polymerase specialized sigma24 family protein